MSTLDRLRPRWSRPAVVANLVAQVGIIGTGGLVRLTGSGLGCSTWPLCEPGSFTPVAHEATSFHPFVEFGNRTLTGVLSVLAFAVLLLVTTDRSRARDVRVLGGMPLVGVAIQAVVGGMSVLLHLSPAVVGMHMLISLGLVAVSSWLLVRHGEGDGPAVPTVEVTARRLNLALGAVAVVLLVLGVVTTGAGPHSGDDEVGYRFAIDPLTMARVHAAAVWVFTLVAVALWWRLRRSGGAPARAAAVLLVVTAAQGLIGYTQVATGLPIALVNLHMIGAALLVVALVRLAGTMRVRAAAEPAVPPPGLREASAA